MLVGEFDNDDLSDNASVEEGKFLEVVNQNWQKYISGLKFG